MARDPANLNLRRGLQNLGKKQIVNQDWPRRSRPCRNWTVTGGDKTADTGFPVVIYSVYLIDICSGFCFCGRGIGSTARTCSWVPFRAGPASE